MFWALVLMAKLAGVSDAADAEPGKVELRYEYDIPSYGLICSRVNGMHVNVFRSEYNAGIDTVHFAFNLCSYRTELSSTILILSR